MTKPVNSHQSFGQWLKVLANLTNLTNLFSHNLGKTPLFVAVTQSARKYLLSSDRLQKPRLSPANILYGLFPPTEMEMETDPCMENFPDRYIVLCRTFSTGTEMETEMETETFPDGYCTHFRDGSLSQGQILIPILL